jgi:hypothetical protein
MKSCPRAGFLLVPLLAAVAAVSPRQAVAMALPSAPTVAGGALLSSPKPSAEAGTPLPLTNFFDMVIDGAHGHVFVTGGPGNSSIVVLDFNGSIVTTLTDEADAAGMALSQDGAILYVALADSSGIDKIDTETLAKTGSISLGSITTTGALALAGGLLWSGYGECAGISGIMSIDPATELIRQYSGVDYPDYCPYFVVSEADPNVMVAWDLYLGPVTLREYRVDVDPPALLAERFMSEYKEPRDFAYIPDGTKILVPDLGGVQEINASDLSDDGPFYPTPYNSTAVDVLGPAVGYLLAGSPGGFDPSAAVTFAVGSVDRLRTAYQGPPGIYDRAVAFGPDGSKAFTVTGDPGVSATFNVIHEPLMPIPHVPSDFNGDELSDLAIGVPWEDVGSAVDTGALSVLYATGTGLTATGNQFWDETSTGSAVNAVLDGLGFSSASGDFNGDGIADLAAGVPGKQIGSIVQAGAVSVLYGTPGGLTSAESQQWNQDSIDVEETAETSDFFGWSVGAGDFDGDGFDDLAVGVPGESVGTKTSAGAVNVLYGSGAGLTAAGDQVWHENIANINGKAETSDQFGLSVGVGDFDGNGYVDLAIGEPTENLDAGADCGVVHVIYGSASGLSSTDDDLWHQDSTGINNVVEKDDWFGYRVSSGDFDGDSFDDLLIGVPEEDLTGGNNAGMVSVIYGTASGLASAGDDTWHQDVANIENVAEANDEFGLTVAAGDFDGDGYDDAAIGVPSEELGGAIDPGAVAVIYGTAGGLDDPNDDFWHQNSSGIDDVAEDVDIFGYAVMAANFGNGPEDDLAIGVVWETVGTVQYAGAVNVIYGSPSDLTSTGDQFWNQDSTDVLDQAEYDDEFGFGLAQPGSGPSGRPAGSVGLVVDTTSFALR